MVNEKPHDHARASTKFEGSASLGAASIVNNEKRTLPAISAG